MTLPNENTPAYDASLSPGVTSGPGAAVTHSAVYDASSNIASTNPNSPGAVGTPGSPGAVGAPGGVGAPATNQTGPFQFSSMDLPNVQFPANVHQVQDFLVGLPHDQQQKWRNALAKLPQNTSYSTLQELQQACQQVMDNQTA